MTRLDSAAFDLPVEGLRDGWYTDAYFNHAREALDTEGLHPRVLMQVFQRHDAVLGGIDEALAVLRLCAGSPPRRWRLGAGVGPARGQGPRGGRSNRAA